MGLLAQSCVSANNPSPVRVTWGGYWCICGVLSANGRSTVLHMTYIPGGWNQDDFDKDRMQLCQGSNPHSTFGEAALNA